MYSVARLDELGAPTPPDYETHSRGYTRAGYVGRAMGSVHMAAAINRLAPGGLIEPHRHSFEESFYVLEGQLIGLVGDEAFTFGPGHFGLIATGARHGFRNAGAGPVRWVEMQAPQPRLPGHGHDTFWVAGEVPPSGAAPAPAFPLGYFDEANLPRPGGPSQMEGFNPTTGVAIQMFVDRSFGAIHQSLFDSAHGVYATTPQLDAQRVNSVTRTMGVALTGCTPPAKGTPIFTLTEDEMEMGVGIHGAPGRKRVKLTNANAIMDELFDSVASDLPFKSGDDVALMINGLGGTPISELYLLYGHAHDIATKRGLKIKRNYVGEYCTSLEMAGCSLTLVKLDPELEGLLAAPAEIAIRTCEARRAAE